MSSEELRLKLLLLGFEPEKVPFVTELSSYKLDKLKVYYSHFSDNWFYMFKAKKKNGDYFHKPSKKLDAETMHSNILKRLGIENG